MVHLPLSVCEGWECSITRTDYPFVDGFCWDWTIPLSSQGQNYGWQTSISGSI